MLTLNRRRDEVVWIRTPEGRNIRILVADVHGRQVRLGFTAAPEVEIVREEIMEGRGNIEIK